MLEEGSAPVRVTRADAQHRRRVENGSRTDERHRRIEKAKVERADWRDRKWLAREFIAWDGEGVTRDDGSHDYLLIANSRNDLLSSLDHLGTEELFEWLLENNTKGTINVIYGASYDWNMWLRDLTQGQLQILYDEQRLIWGDYKISWRRGKTFQIQRGKESVIFYDVVSFFQCSFVKACDSYLDDAFEDRERIVENKRLRSGFRASDLRDIAEYNRSELVNLVKLMNELRIRLYRAELKPSRWDGPGAIAVALMGGKGVPDHMEQAPASVAGAIRSGYFGGRFEVVKAGHVERPAFEYDINSAYPWALLDVPSLAGGSWDYVTGDPGRLPFALYNLRYRSSTAESFPQPLPCRYPTGATAYPRAVTGWYWSPEYEVASEYVAMYGGNLEVLGAWVFTPTTDYKPFHYIEPLFNKRRALKKAGDGAHVGIKLGLNSQYGKLAQQVGWRRDRRGGIHIPPYHQLDWAGYVTSKCRAAVLRAALPTLDRVIAWETDAMFSEVPLNVQEGSGLGDWEYTEFADLTYLQSGMYFANLASGGRVDKTRGVDLGSLTRADVLSAMRDGDTHVPARLTRFITLGAALQGRFEHWSRWETGDKRIALAPGGKRQHVGCSTCDPGFRLGEWHSTIIAPWAIGRVSCEYEIEWANPGLMSEQLRQLRQGHYEGSRYDD